MQSTKALGSLKNLFVQPLPLNKRESEKLLKAITTSFRAQLDREHGWTPELSETDLAAPTISYLPSSTASSSSTKLPSSSQKPNPSHRPVDRHFQAVLENPLFKHNGTTPLPGITSHLSELVADPRTVFEAGVAKGIMTVPRAHGFLLKSKEVIQQSAALSVRKSMAEYGAGLMVLNWLRASGQERQLSFLENTRFTRLLLQFMVAEGVDDLAWIWLKRLASPEGQGVCSTSASSLLDTLVGAQYINNVELEGAYKLVIEGHALFQKNGLANSEIHQTWKSLAWETTGHSWRHTLPGTGRYDAFLDIPEQLPYLGMHKAHLKLHHPTQPSADPAVEFILNSTPRNAPKAPSELQKFRMMINSLALDTCAYLMKRDDVQGARAIFDKLSGLGFRKFKGYDYLLQNVAV
ncbi:hypothetical protein V8F20_008602 [Naviculisporaceae sp. PSN 640]